MELNRILVVDDEPNMVRLIQVILECQGYVVRTANNGTQAWEILQTEPVDLIIIDNIMPDVHGAELHRQIRASETLR